MNVVVVVGRNLVELCPSKKGLYPIRSITRIALVVVGAIDDMLSVSWHLPAFIRIPFSIGYLAASSGPIHWLCPLISQQLCWPKALQGLRLFHDF
jgi:hypothetical protein